MEVRNAGTYRLLEDLTLRGETNTPTTFKTGMLLTISFPISLTFERTEYGYYLYKTGEEGSFYAGIDTMNGQFIYVWEHEGEDILSVLLGV